MANVREDVHSGFLHVSLPATRPLPLNPHIHGRMPTRLLGPPSSVVDTSHTSAIEFPQDKKLHHELLREDQRSFITRSASASLQACHIINTVRRDPERKEQVESLLTQQAILQGCSDVFVLDDISNAILLEANLHVEWDVYGTFCIVPTLEQVMYIADALRTSNQQWEEESQRNGYIGRRPLNVANAPFKDPSWEIIMMYPHGLLPDGQPLAILRNPPIYQRTEPNSMTFFLPAQPFPPSWEFWVPGEDDLCKLENNSLNPLPAFKVSSARPPNRPISVLAMIINAQAKLRQFVGDNPASTTPRIRVFANATSSVVSAIFFRPALPIASNTMPIRGGGYTTVYDMPKSFSPMQPTIASSSQSGPPLSTGQEQLRGGTCTSLPSSPVSPESPEPPEMPQEDGLTDSEFRRLGEMANDPYLDENERADAAMLMIFGTRGFINPIAERAGLHAYGDEESESGSDAV